MKYLFVGVVRFCFSIFCASFVFHITLMINLTFDVHLTESIFFCHCVVCLSSALLCQLVETCMIVKLL